MGTDADGDPKHKQEGQNPCTIHHGRAQGYPWKLVESFHSSHHKFCLLFLFEPSQAPLEQVWAKDAQTLECFGARARKKNSILSIHPRTLGYWQRAALAGPGVDTQGTLPPCSVLCFLD